MARSAHRWSRVASRPENAASKQAARRRFLKKAAIAAGGICILPDSRSAFGYAANEKLDTALIGVGGRGSWFVQCIPQIGENVTAMCDVNDDRAAESYKKLPGPKKYRDFRRMLDEMDQQIDAVVIAVPDHNHAPIAMAAMQAGKHVYCEKPLTNNIREARVLRKAAKRLGVATQMGNQGTATHAYRRQVELIQSGMLGPVKEVFVWNTGAGFGRDYRPSEEQPAPDYLDWNLWLGPRAMRPYCRQWMQWHRWREFGTGQLGNWCVHSGNIVFKGFGLDGLWLDGPEAGEPTRTIRVEAQVSEIVGAVFPRWEIVRYEYPARGGRPPLEYTWYSGLEAPGLKAKVEQYLGRSMIAGGTDPWIDHAGCIVAWEDGAVLHSTGHNSTFTLLPETRFEDFSWPEPTLPRSGSHEREWLAACRGGPAAMSNFDYGGPLTENIHLGNIATQLDRPIEFDPLAGHFVADEEADRLLLRDEREGWILG